MTANVYSMLAPAPHVKTTSFLSELF